MMLNINIWAGDCREVLTRCADNSVDLVLSDPPYELSFMDKGWDSTGVAFDPALHRQIYRVLKPGCWAKLCSASRTFHRVQQAMVMAGFEETEHNLDLWVYSSGFPKTLNVGKAMNRRLKLGEVSEEEAAQWQGWQTALKPAVEPIVCGKKPL